MVERLHPPRSEHPNELQRRFFAAGLDLLAEEGYGALKLAPLCRRLGLTTGAFYHSFGSWADFTTRLLEHWHDERTTRFVELARAQSDPLRRSEDLVRAAVELQHDAEAAIRVWAGVDADVRRLTERVDAERLSTVTDAFVALCGDPDLADRMARWTLYALVGFQQADSTRDLEALAWGFHLIQRLAIGGELPGS